MSSIKIRNFLFQRLLNNIKQIKYFFSKIFYNSPIYGKLNFEESISNFDIILPNLWKGDAEKTKSFLKSKIPNNKNIKNPFFYYFHSFEFLNGIQEIGKEDLRIYGRELTNNWIKKNSSWKSKTWEDFILASRICNWLKNYNFFFQTSDDNFKKKIFSSIIKQIDHLVKNFSNIRRNSDLIRIIKALIYASIYIPNKKYYYQIAIFNLKSELNKQILKDGCHFQRNPKIHIQVLKDLLDIRAILNSTKKNIFFDLQNSIKKMSIAYRFFLHKDNSLANFNGTDQINYKILNDLSKEIPKPAKNLRELINAGFQRIDTKNTTLILDCGVPKNYNATYKAHSCTGSFEFSYKKNKIIVNSIPDLNKDIKKKTAAHSTLTLNNTNAYKILNNNHLSRIPTEIKVKRIERYGANIIEIENYGYKKQYEAIHKKIIYMDKNGTDVRGEENIYCPMELSYDLRFYLDPKIKAILTNNGKNIVLKLPDGSGWKFISSLDKINLELNRSLNNNRQPIVSEHINLNGITKELITVIKWSLKKF